MSSIAGSACQVSVLTIDTEAGIETVICAGDGAMQGKGFSGFPLGLKHCPESAAVNLSTPAHRPCVCG